MMDENCSIQPPLAVKITQHLLCLFILEKQNYLTLPHSSLPKRLSHAPDIQSEIQMEIHHTTESLKCNKTQ